MLKKTITYTDYNNVERTEDFYFNLTKAELMELELSVNGGLTEMVQRVVAANDNVAIMKIFKDLILKAYGRKSLDGKRFEKSQELIDEFCQTEAYSILFTELALNDIAAAEFVKGIIPASANVPEQLPINATV